MGAAGVRGLVLSVFGQHTGYHSLFLGFHTQFSDVHGGEVGSLAGLVGMYGVLILGGTLAGTVGMIQGHCCGHATWALWNLYLVKVLRKKI